MKALVVYYSLSGNTRSVATALVRELGADADIEELRCDRYSPGAWGYIRAASDSWRGRLPPIGPLAHKISDYELAVVAGPIWAYHPATPVRSFMQRERTGMPRVAFVLTHGGAAGERSLREMESIVGRAPVATLLVTERDIKAQTFSSAVSTFAVKLRNARTA
jgi:hypothetical protein